MSDRLESALAAMDVGLQSSYESGSGTDFAPDLCVRCQLTTPTDEDADLCSACRAFLLGDSEDDPKERYAVTGDLDIRIDVPWTVPPIQAPRGGIRYIEPPWLSPMPERFRRERDAARARDRQVTGWMRRAMEAAAEQLTRSLRDRLGPEGENLRVTFDDAPLIAESGPLDIELVRDSRLAAINNYELFAEQWSGVTFVGTTEAVIDEDPPGLTVEDDGTVHGYIVTRPVLSRHESMAQQGRERIHWLWVVGDEGAVTTWFSDTRHILGHSVCGGVAVHSRIERDGFTYTESCDALNGEPCWVEQGSFLNLGPLVAAYDAGETGPLWRWLGYDYGARLLGIDEVIESR